MTWCESRTRTPGLGVLVHALKKIKAQTQLYFVFDHLDMIFKIYKNKEERNSIKVGIEQH